MPLTLGALTIGQAPRVDVIPELQTLLGAHVAFREAGALDGLSIEAVESLTPEPGDQVLITRMQDGTEVKVAGRHIVPRLQRLFDELEGGVDAFLLLCTGTFPPFRCSRPIVYPERLLFGLVRAIAPRHVGVLTPDPLQIPEQQARWRQVATQVTIVPCSPYRKDARVHSAARQLAEAGVDLIALDSLGYPLAMKEVVRHETNRPVLLARTVLARIASELL